MAEESNEDEGFLESSLVEALIPHNAQLPLEELLKREAPVEEADNPSLLPWVSQREFLFLDETLQCVLLIRIPATYRKALAEILARLDISLELWATGIGPTSKSADQRASSVKENLAEVKIDASKGHSIDSEKLGRSSTSDAEQWTYVFWSTSVLLQRPRTKLNKLSVYVVPSVILRTPRKITEDESDKYLPSMVPQSINLLQPFEFDPRFHGRGPYLPASRITKVAPAAAPPSDPGRRLRTVPRRFLRAGPALFWRVRFSQTSAPPRTNWIFASLELEVTRLWQCNISIKDISLKLAKGNVIPVGPRLPNLSRPGDHFTVVYKLVAPSEEDMFADSKSGVMDQLDISISAVVIISEECRPQVNISWSTSADFTAQKRPLSRPASRPASAVEAPRSLGPDSLPYSGEAALDKPATPVGPTGVTVTITGPEKITVATPFRWEVFIVNRSEIGQSFAVIPIRKPSSQIPMNKAGNTDLELHDLPVSWFFQPSELMCMSAIARTGHLPASACCTCELKFVATAPGVFDIDAIRIVELNTRRSTDITDLPDIVVTLRADANADADD